MSGKKVGIVVFIACILLALILVGVRGIKITKKDTSTTKQTTASQTSVNKTTEVAGTTEGVSATSLQSEAVLSSQEQVKEQEQAQENVSKEEAPESVSSEDISLKKIVAEDKLSYSGEEQTTIGTVKSKNCYLSGSQVVYCLDIDVTMGTSGEVVQYYCTYSTYEGVSEGTKLSVVYKQTTKNTFALMQVTKA